MKESYITLAHSANAEFVEKKSRFLSFAAPVKHEAEAQAFLSEIRSSYPDARHCVYAYRITSTPPYATRYSDDGEPQGTGGMPVLDVLQKKDIGDAVIAVVRYFGGILLGAPGLVRAYSSAASLAVSEAGMVRMMPLVPFEVCVSYSFWGKVEAAFSRMALSTDVPEYAEEVRSVFYILPEQVKNAISTIADLSSGKAAYTIGEVQFFAVPIEKEND